MTSMKVGLVTSCLFNIKTILLIDVLFHSPMVHSLTSDRSNFISFILEPPSKVEFYNTTGVVIPCAAIGDPKPSIHWITLLDGVKVNQVTGLRHLRSDGSLMFTPFKESDYRQDVHFNVYRCIASNSLGTVGSRDVHVTSVIKQNYNVQVMDEFSIKGNTAVLRCNIPAFAKSYLSVTSWIQNELVTISNSYLKETPYSVFTDGHLHIRNITPADSVNVYRCITRNKLSGEVSASASVGRLIITEPQSNILPHLVHYTSKLTAIKGQTVELGCAFQGYPPPTYSWFKLEAEGTKKSLNSFLGDHLKYLQTEGSLVIKDVTLKDEAIYLCFVNNSSGQKKVEIELTIEVPLKVAIWPSLITAKPGQSAKFECNITGHPIEDIVWTKDQKILEASSKYHFVTPRVLQIWDVTKSETGMYQCYVYTQNESTQSMAQLKLADEAPIIKESFVTQTVKLGQFVSLKCIASGNPLPQITWTVDDELIVESNNRVSIGDFVTPLDEVVSYVNISNVKVEEGGHYGCHANNEVKKVSTFGRVNVVHSPIVKPMRDITAIEGEQLMISCSYSGFPVKDIFWEHNNRRTPYNHRQKLFKNGTLMISFVDKQDDIGDYQCIVKGGPEAGANKATGRRKVQVQSPPVIDPFEFPRTLEEGDRSKILCTVMKGDPPFVIRWFKDGQLIEDTSQSVVILDDYSVALIFSKVTLADRGNYTCTANNAVASANHTSVAVVHARPRWIIEPINTVGVKGKDVILHCQADGFPEPVIEWKRASGDSLSSSYKPIGGEEKFTILSNHSLEIKGLDKSDSGFYMCQASNGIGSGISTVIELQTRSPAHFEEEFRVETVQKGATLVIQCKALGDKPLKIDWQKDGQELKIKFDQRYKITELIVEEGMISEIRVQAADRRDSSLFACHASNAYGNDKTSIQVIVQEKPDPPTKASIVKIESQSLSLTWSPPYAGNIPIIYYIIEYKEADYNWSLNRNHQRVPDTETRVVIKNLSPGTKYQLRIIAVNRLGRSEPGPVLEATTEIEVPSEPPYDVKAEPYGSNSIKIKWRAPKLSQHFSPHLQGYYVGYKLADSDQPFVFKTIETHNQNDHFEFILNNLNHVTKYKLIVKAFNQKGSGPSSPEVVLKTRDIDLPEAPTLEVLSSSHKTITIKWQVIKTKAHALGFRLYIREEGEPWSEYSLNPSERTYTFNNLLCGTKYNIYLQAYNEAGNGLPSNLVKTKTHGNAPKAPSIVSFINTNQSSINLLLKEWENGGCPIKNFLIQYRVFDSPNWKKMAQPIPGHLKEYLLQELNPATPYKIRVTAQSESGSTQAEYNFQVKAESGFASGTGWNSGDQDYSWINLIVFPILAITFVLACILILVCGFKKSARSQVLEPGIMKNSLSYTDEMPMSELSLKQNRNSLAETTYRPKECLYFSSNSDPLGLEQCSNSPLSTCIKSSALDHPHRVSPNLRVYDIPFILNAPKQNQSSGGYSSQVLGHTYSYPLKKENRTTDSLARRCSDFKTVNSEQHYSSSWSRTLN